VKLYHVSEESGIEIFKPRLSPQAYENITGDVVFAITDNMLHNYLLPRDCPRVAYYAKADTLQSDIDKFICETKAKYVIYVENAWRERIKNTELYLYELPPDTFTALDEGAGYYISNKAINPLNVKAVKNLPYEIAERNAELRFLPSIKQIADDVSKSTLQFSVIRLRNAV
jgi:hypothetical protein